MPPNKHKRLGASSAHRWMECPGSIRMSQGIKDDPSPYAEEGSAAHFLAETCFRKAQITASRYLDRVIRRIEEEGFSMLKAGAVAESGDFVVTEEMCEAVQVYLDTVRRDTMALPTMKMEIEKQFDLSSLHPDLGGTNDALLWEDYGKVIIYDYKHGAGYAVNVEDNPQLLYYALGAYLGTDCGEVEIVIVQPRARHADGPVRRYALPVLDLINWANEKLLPAARATEAPDAPLNPGDWCRFCRAKAICPALADHAKAIAKSDLSTIPLPEPDALSLNDLIRVLQSKDLLVGWLKAVEGHAFTLLQNGQTVPGYKLVRARANRQWADEKELVGRFFSNKKDLYVKKLVSPAQFEKLYKAKDWKIKYEDLIEKPEGKLTIAPEADKRPAVNPLAQLRELPDECEF